MGNRAWPEVMVVSRWPMADRVGQVLVVPILHLRLVVVQVHLRRPADHVQIDHVLGLGRKMRAARRPARRRRVAGRCRQRGRRPTARPGPPRPGHWPRGQRTAGGFRSGPSLRTGSSARSSHSPCRAAAITCSGLRPGSSTRWSAWSRRPAPRVQRRDRTSIADGQQLLGVVRGCAW